MHLHKSELFIWKLLLNNNSNQFVSLSKFNDINNNDNDHRPYVL